MIFVNMILRVQRKMSKSCVKCNNFRAFTKMLPAFLYYFNNTYFVTILDSKPPFCPCIFCHYLI